MHTLKPISRPVACFIRLGALLVLLGNVPHVVAADGEGGQKAKSDAAKPTSQTAPGSTAKPKSTPDKKNAQPAKEQAIIDMEDLATKAVEIALEFARRGQVMRPFALLMNDQRNISLLHPKGNAPDDDNALLAGELQALRAAAKSEPSVIAGALARAYQIERGGKTIKGVLVETDHRRQSPRAVFVPLNMKGKTIYPGKAEVGISENWMFEPVKQVK